MDREWGKACREIRCLSPEKVEEESNTQNKSLHNNLWKRKPKVTKRPTRIADVAATHRPCASWREPWCKTSSHRSRRRTSSRRSRGRSCCARVATTASWRPCHMLHTWGRKKIQKKTEEKKAKYSYYWSYLGIIWNSLYKHNPRVWAFTDTWACTVPKKQLEAVD